MLKVFCVFRGLTSDGRWISGDDSCNQKQRICSFSFVPYKGSLQGNLEQVNKSNFPNSWLGDTVRGAVRVAGPGLVWLPPLESPLLSQTMDRGAETQAGGSWKIRAEGWIKAGWGQSGGRAGPGVRSFHLPPISHQPGQASCFRPQPSQNNFPMR